MVPAGTRIDAIVTGSFDVLKAPGALEGAVIDALAPYGTVIAVNVSTSLFSSTYTASVSFVPSVDHASIDDVRGILAGAFESWNGLRPSVTITGPATFADAGVPPSSSGAGLNTTIVLVIAGLVVLAIVLHEI